MEKSVLFKIVRAILVLALALAVAGLLVTLRPRAERIERDKPKLLVEVSPAEAKDLHMTVQTYGTVKARETLNLVAEVRGRIVHIHPSFTEGGFIGQGEILVRIDPRSYELEVERAHVQLEQVDAEWKLLAQQASNVNARIAIVEADVTLARAELSRLQKLSLTQAIAQTTLDKTEQRYLASLEGLQVLKNQLALIEPQRDRLEAEQKMIGVLLRQAKLDLERTQIVSLFDGWVLEKTIESGQHVTPAQHLGRMYRAGALDIDVRIPLKDLKWLPDISKQNTPTRAEIMVDAAVSTSRWGGSVARAKAQVDDRTRTLPVVIEIDPLNPSEENFDGMVLRPGTFVQVSLKGIDMTGVFALPRHVVHPDNVVYIVKDDRLIIRPVHVIRRFENIVYVDKGLSEGEWLITSPVPSVLDGMEVRVISESATS